jgi:threonine/homoserine/homoserine lactone efflux protein
MRPVPVSVHVATTVLFINILAALLDAPGWIVIPLFLFGPGFVHWMVFQVLRDKEHGDAPRLGKGEHWGYQDRPDLKPRSGQ